MPQGESGSHNRQLMHSANNAIVQRYGDAHAFALTFNPDLQAACGANIERSFTGTAPLIAELIAAYEMKAVRVWVYAQLENLNVFVGAQNKIEPLQMSMLAEIILTDYLYLKASELLLFFYQLKSGKYGKFYGSVDPLQISVALTEFAAYRRDMIFRLENEKRIAENLMRAEDREANAITRGRYLRRKFLKTEKKVKIIKKKV